MTHGKDGMMDDIGQAPEIPFVEALRVEMTGNRHMGPISLPPLVEILKSSAAPVFPSLLDAQWEYKAFAEIAFKQIAPRGSEADVMRHGIRAFCHHLYGPFERELRLVQEDLWRLGVKDSSPAMQRINRLISVMRGDPV